MAPADDLARIAQAAQAHGTLAGVLPVELVDGTRVYLCAYASGDWLALGDDERPVTSRRAVHDAASLSALCEVAEELAGVETSAPRVATTEHLDRVGAAVAAGIEQALPSVRALADRVVARHLTPLA
ncbi:MAG: hypothetical protein KGI93_08005 [Acidobacteriota bacterium]|nr:hypothetical protein [Acidobacteriota bacterium]MDE3191712.1 hypothetical protein [Acidobacteriota bacterium]